MDNTAGMSYAAIHRIAVREALRSELAQALGEIERSTHAAVGRRDPAYVYWYGSRTACEDFADGIEREVQIVKMTPEIKERLSAGKCAAYRRLPGYR